MKKRDPTLRSVTELTCRCCGQTKPVGAFQRLPRGTFRHVCRQCKYQFYDRLYREAIQEV